MAVPCSAQSAAKLTSNELRATFLRDFVHADRSGSSVLRSAVTAAAAAADGRTSDGAGGVTAGRSIDGGAGPTAAVALTAANEVKHHSLLSTNHRLGNDVSSGTAGTSSSRSAVANGSVFAARHGLVVSSVSDIRADVSGLGVTTAAGGVREEREAEGAGSVLGGERNCPYEVLPSSAARWLNEAAKRMVAGGAAGRCIEAYR